MIRRHLARGPRVEKSGYRLRACPAAAPRGPVAAD